MEKSICHLKLPVRDNKTQTYHKVGEEVIILGERPRNPSESDHRKVVTVQFLDGTIGYCFEEELEK